jgi:hypothetical protein
MSKLNGVLKNSLSGWSKRSQRRGARSKPRNAEAKVEAELNLNLNLDLL